MASLEALQAANEARSRAERARARRLARESMLESDAHESEQSERPADASALPRAMLPAKAGVGCQQRQKSMTSIASSVTSETVMMASSATSGAVMVVGAAACRDQLESKKLFRPSAKITRLMPRGSSGLKTKVPKRIDFGVAF